MMRQCSKDEQRSPRCNAARSGRTHCLLSWGLVLLFMMSGCQTWQKTHSSALSAWAEGDLSTSLSRLQKSQDSMRAEREMLELDRAVLELASGHPDQAETRFRRLREELDHLAQKDLTEQATAMMTDARAVAYSGRDYERTMVLNMALLSSILHDNQDAFAWSLQIDEASAERRTLIAEAVRKKKEEAGSRTESEIATVSFPGPEETAETPVFAPPSDQSRAFGAWLSAMVQSETPSRAEETEMALQAVRYWNPQFGRQATPAAPMGIHGQRGAGTLHVIAFIGQAPHWVSESAEPTSTAMLIADRIISATGKHTLPPTLASVKIAKPEITCPPLPSGALRCQVTTATDPTESTARRHIEFSTLTDLNQVAFSSYEEHRDEEIAAAIVRRVMKKGTVYVLKEAQNIHRNTWVDLGVNAAGVVWEAMEKADTRSWRTLPARIDVASLELPAGQWNTHISLAGQGSSQEKSVTVNIADGRNTCVVLMIPDRKLTGCVLVGGADNQSVPVD